MLRVVIRLLAVVLLIGVSACASKRIAPGKVTGLVTYKGEPLKSGNLTFHTKDNKGNYQSSLNTDGKYEVFELPVGTHDVTIETESLNPNRKVPTYGGAMGKGKAGEQQRVMMGAPDPKTLAERWRAIPKKYADPKTSGLTATITAGNQSVNFDLTD
jgi:uncharacterized protein YxeA